VPLHGVGPHSRLRAAEGKAPPHPSARASWGCASELAWAAWARLHDIVRVSVRACKRYCARVRAGGRA
jgi:hypothetical protein